MCRMYDMRHKEVINVEDGCRYGYVTDIEIDIKKGNVTAIIVPGPAKIFGMFGCEQEYFIPWCNIKQIGHEIILVDMPTEDALKDIV